MKKIRRARPGVKLGAPDPSLTPRAGLRLVAEVDRILSVAATLDGHIGELKARKRALSAGELVVSMAETMLAGREGLNWARLAVLGLHHGEGGWALG